MATAGMRCPGVASSSGRGLQWPAPPSLAAHHCVHAKCKRALQLRTAYKRPVKYRRPSLIVSRQATADAPAKKRGRKPAPAGLPTPGAYQQTLKKSFTVGGLGLHTGEYAYVRVRPARAGEGRYFVRVPEGTNCHLFEIDEPAPVDAENLEGDEDVLDQDEEDMQLEVFRQFLSAQEGGYMGTFVEYVEEEVADKALALFGDITEEEEEEGVEEVVPRAEDEVYVQASVDNVSQEQYICTVLGQGDHRVENVQPLLSALEAFGVDNARIEIEGGPEIPIIDGSAMGWCVEIHRVGLRLATNPQHKEKMRRLQLVPKQPVTVREGDAFVSFFPEDTVRLTYGIDHKNEAPIIGKQWFSWAPDEDEHYRWEIGPARMYAASLEYLYGMRDAGFVKGGAVGCAIIGFGDRWYEPDQVRYPDDEPVRHEMLGLMGDLSLLAENGNAGLPVGHVVAYKADHDLHIKFAQALQDSCTRADLTAVKLAAH
ncbi:hypothetical protein WJX72_010533 [[Myrmecia] bisecta]|uniref:UDP-3-O-acyl-N-acetylglucosamine deacetylase n=1 Tax=[Myrmecia] bisecta TaxID=41462 RepID=A0AAW1Q1P5_9CHLO